MPLESPETASETVKGGKQPSFWWPFAMLLAVFYSALSRLWQGLSAAFCSGKVLLFASW